MNSRLMKCLAVCLAVCFLPLGAYALTLKTETGGQRELKSFIENTNKNLQSLNEQEINSLFESYKSFAVFGITSLPDAETPEEIEITAELLYSTINRITLRVCNLDRFPAIAAAMLQAASPTSDLKEIITVPTEKTRIAKKNPEDSFEEQITELNGTVTYAYYAYYPNQYKDGKNWMQLTLVFPLEGYNHQEIREGTTTTKGPDTYSGNNDDYEGYYSQDDYSHLDVYVRETPEPGSAADDELKK